MEGYCITIWPASESVKKLLPPDLSLDPPTGLRPKERHPIVFLFCRQKNVRPGFVPFGGMRYHEIIELIPFVKRHDVLDGPAGGPFSYMPYLFLDEIAPVWIGVNLYGFNKRLARITSDRGSFQLQSDLGEITTDLSAKGLPGAEHQRALFAPGQDTSTSRSTVYRADVERPLCVLPSRLLFRHRDLSGRNRDGRSGRSFRSIGFASRDIRGRQHP